MALTLIKLWGTGLKNKPAAQAAGADPSLPPIGKIHCFSKMAVTFDPLMGF
jgi:hypothetical protein